mmetsp:Transcript_35709/g.113512  ORF Transcript_35709/g.113512 Transcript_35709/m.113512 type:complete len:237 (-) Transcript_35709:21-731(-)
MRPGPLRWKQHSLCCRALGCPCGSPVPCAAAHERRIAHTERRRRADLKDGTLASEALRAQRHGQGHSDLPCCAQEQRPVAPGAARRRARALPEGQVRRRRRRAQARLEAWAHGAEPGERAEASRRRRWGDQLPAGRRDQVRVHAAPPWARRGGAHLLRGRAGGAPPEGGRRHRGRRPEDGRDAPGPGACALGGAAALLLHDGVRRGREADSGGTDAGDMRTAARGERVLTPAGRIG